MVMVLGWPVEPVEPVQIGIISDFIISGKRAYPAQPVKPKSCEHFNVTLNEVIGPRFILEISPKRYIYALVVFILSTKIKKDLPVRINFGISRD